MGKNIIDIYRVKIKKSIDAVVAVAKQGYTTYIDSYPSINYITFTIRNYNPRNPPKIVSYPHYIIEYYTSAQKDLQDLYIIILKNKRDLNTTIGLVRSEEEPFCDKDITLKEIKVKNIPYTESRFKKKYIKELIRRAKRLAKERFNTNP